ncbi:MAG: hypothetical protein U0802_13780 [Candidatus Binatia bacterium]
MRDLWSMALSMLMAGGLLTACGLTAAQRDAAGTFSRAAVSVGDFASTTFPAMRQAAIDMNTTDVIIGGSAPADQLDQHFPLDAVAERVAAAQALSNYGTLLQALVDDTEAAALKTASDNFVASVRNVRGKSLSDDQYQALGTIVQEIGGAIVEAKKARAVKEIATQVRPDIDHLCDLLAQDFAPTGGHLAQGLDVTRMRLDSDADLNLARARSDAERARAVDAIGQVAAAQATLEVLDTRAVATVQQLKVANGALVSALAERQYSLEDLRGASQQVQRLSAAVKTLAGR